MSYFKSFTFAGKRSAGNALDAIEDNSDNDYLWIDDVAVISVNKRGHYRVHSTWAQDSDNVAGGIGFGAICGGLIGLLFGPVGALAGAAVGGSVGGLIGDADNVEFNDPVLGNFAASLKPDTSALVIVGDAVSLTDLTTELAAYEVVAYETELDKDAEKALKKAMKK